MTSISDNYKIAVVSHSEELANEILSAGRNVLLCRDKENTLYDILTMKKINISDDNAGGFFNDLDVVEYVPNKGLYKIFDIRSNDNALILSNKCNSCCVMCPYSDNFRRNADNISAEKILNLIKHILVYPEHLTITGGEPTLIGEKITDIMSLLKSRFPETSYLFLTNGRIFSVSEYCKNILSCCPDDICFAIPLYGDSPSTHDPITNSAGSFTEAVKGIQALLKRHIKVEIRIVVSKLNYNNLQNISHFISNYLSSACVVNFVGLEMCGNAARNRDKVWITYKNAFEKIAPAIDILCRNDIDVGIYNFPLCSVQKEYRALCRKSISDYKIVYYDKCEQCSLKPICGGIFRSTFLLQKPEMSPVITNA